MKQLLLATRNKDKIGELRSLFADINVELLTVDQFPHIGEVEEDQDSLEANAVKKAREVSKAAGLPSLADDSGLEVFYLNNAPGVYSSRYAGANATYADNCKKLLENLRGVPPRRRAAQFRCVLTLAVPGHPEKSVEGVCPGTIAESPRGGNGFGYDPIFVPNGYRQTLAELDSSLKNTLSHRAKAAEKMKILLPGILSSHMS